MSNNLKEPGKLLFANWSINLYKIPIEQLDHYIAVENFLTDEDELPFNAENIEKVNHYLEAFHHLCEVEDWERAKTVIMIKIGTLIDEELHIQLGTWGCFQKQVDLCSRLLGKTDIATDSICFNTLGLAYDSLSNYPQAIKYYEQDLIITRELNDRRGEGITLGNLGNAYFSLNLNSQALEFFEQALLIAQKIKDRKDEGNALGNLGNLYSAITNYAKAIEYHSQSLSIAQEINDLKGEGKAFGCLGSAYRHQSNYSKALECVQKYLEIARKIEDQYAEALDYLQAALNIVKETGQRSTEAIILYNLVEVYLKLGDRDMAQESCDKALVIATELDLPDLEEYQELKEQLLSDKT